MEAIGQVNNVAPKHRFLAVGLLAILLGGIVITTIKEVVAIAQTKDEPPVSISFANAANRDVDFGPMPFIAFKLESYGEDFGPQFNTSKTILDKNERLWKRFSCSPSSVPVCPPPVVSVVTTKHVNKPSQNNVAILDMTHIQPQWEGGVTPFVEIILHSNSSRPRFTFYNGDANALAQASRHHWHFQDFKGHSVGKLSKSQPGCIRMFIEMDKGIVPTQGTCWGFPWQDDCTKEDFGMVFSSFSPEEPVSDDCESGQIKIQIIVRSFLVRQVVPVGLCTQFYTLFTESLGGSLALMASAFLFLFVRKYPPTHNEAMNAALTLRGTEENERPSFEEYQEMESHNKDAESEDEA